MALTPQIIQALSEPIADHINEVRSEVRSLRSGVVTIADESRAASRAAAEIVSDSILHFAANWIAR